MAQNVSSAGSSAASGHWPQDYEIRERTVALVQQALRTTAVFADEKRKALKQPPSPFLHGCHLKALSISLITSNFSSSARSSAAQRRPGQILVALCRDAEKREVPGDALL